MSIRAHVLQTFDDLNEEDLVRVAEFLDILKFRNRFHAASISNEAQVAEMYAEFAEADRVLAEKGMPDYMAGLGQEDIRQAP
jgi:outer membrane protein assembly factor BamD (BamD/ComL family)